MDRKRSRPASDCAQYDCIDLNLRALDIFVQVADSGGISPAARRLGLTQSAVSQIIASLEKSIGAQLLDRNVRPIAATPAGIILLDKARGVLLCAREAMQAARAPASAALPKLNICLVGSIAGKLGLDLISSTDGFAATLSVHAGSLSQHSRSLLTREVDIMISPDPLEDEPNLERHLILREKLCLLLPGDYEGEVDDLATLARTRDLVRLSPRTMLGRQIERHLRRLRIEAKGRIEFDDPEGVMALVAANMGWALLAPSCMLLGRSFWPKLRVMPAPGQSMWREIYVIARDKELGDIPRKMASKVIASVDRIFRAELGPCCPWMLDQYILPGRSFGRSPNGASLTFESSVPRIRSQMSNAKAACCSPMRMPESGG